MANDVEVKLAVALSEQAHIKEKVERIEKQIEEMHKTQAAGYQHITDKLTKIDIYLSRQKGVLATTMAIWTAIWGVILTNSKSIWEWLQS